MYTKIYVPMDDDERKALQALAMVEMRSIFDQARFLIRSELKRRGMLPEDASVNHNPLNIQQ